jgi:hypothetical protein
MCVIIRWLTYLSGEKNESAGPFMRPQCAVNRTKMRHLKGHPKLNLNQLTIVDSLNECPNLTLHNGHQYILNICRTHRVKGPQSRNHRPPMHTKLAPSKARGVIFPTQFDSEKRGEHIK